MKNIILFFIVSLFHVHKASSQDVIFKRNGDEIKSKVSEVTETEIRFKKTDNPNGPTFAIMKSEVMMIKYANGTKDVFQMKDTKTQETFYDNAYAEKPKQPKPPRKPTKYLNITRIGGGFPVGKIDYGDSVSNPTKSTSGLFSISTIQGYKIIDKFSCAAGIGLDIYQDSGARSTEFSFPLFFDLRYSILGDNTGPLIYLEIGNTFGHDRGVMIEPGAALKIKMGFSSLQVSTGYLIQQVQNPYHYSGYNNTSLNVYIHYFTLRLGVSF